MNVIVCLCGSTRFKDKMMEIARDFTLSGHIVLMPNVFAHSGDTITDEQKQKLDLLHREKIKMADIVFIVNQDDYIGSSTNNEILFALENEKIIDFLENGENRLFQYLRGGNNQ